VAVVHYQTDSPAGTQVHTEDGLKPIEEIKIGDLVLSYNENTETLSYQPVTDLIQGKRQYRLVEITLDSGKSIETTAEHPFYIKGKGWNPAGSLSVGQVLELHNGTVVVVKEIDTSVRRELVYNFTVANTHNYFVGEDGVLVHNTKVEACVTLWKAPARGRTGVADEVVNGYDPKRYPDNGPYFSTTRSVAEEYQYHYQNGLQEINIPKNEYDDLLNREMINVDGYEVDSVHVPPENLDEFNKAIQKGPPNVYHPEENCK